MDTPFTTPVAAATPIVDRRHMLHRSAIAIGSGLALGTLAACSTTGSSDATGSTRSNLAAGSTIIAPTTAPLSALPQPVTQVLDAAMREAITQAKTAKFPFGAVLVRVTDGAIVAGSANETTGGDPSAHAEVAVLRKAGLAKIDHSQTVLVTTAESCPMCASCAVWAGVAGVAYGSSIDFLVASGWKQIRISQPMVVSQGFVAMPVVAGVLRDETDPLYRAGPPR